jgi:hypothetical protein
MQKKRIGRPKKPAYVPLLTPDTCEKCGTAFKECTNQVQARKRTYYLCCTCMGIIRTLLSDSLERTVIIFMRSRKVQ